MAGSYVGKYDTTAANNTATGTGSVSIAEGMLPSNVNNAMRDIMADIRQWYNSAEWIEYGDGAGTYTPAYASGTSFTIASADVTSAYHVGRRVKAVGSSTGTIYGSITATAFSTNTTVTVSWDSGSLSNESLTIYIGITSATNTSMPETPSITGDYTLDVSGDIVLDAGGADVVLKDDGTQYGTLTNTSGNLIIKSGSTTALTFSGANATLAGDLTISGDDLTMGTNTSGHVLVADGTNFNPVAISGDVTIASNGAVTIGSGTVETAMIAADAITGAKIADDAINSEHYTDGSIDTAHIADSQVTADKLASSAVTTAKINADAVTGAKIADDAINSEHYTDASIDTAHIADDQVTQDKIADDAVGADQLASNAVVNASVASGAAIADSKLDTISTANKVSLAALDIDGASAIGEAVVDADLFIVDNGAGGTNRKVAASVLKTYAQTGVSSAADDITVGDAAVTIGNGSTSADITIDSGDDIVIDAAGGNIEFKDSGTLQFTIDMDGTAGVQIVKLGVDSDDLVFQQYDGNEVVRVADDRRLYFYDKGGEYISSDGSALTLASGGTAFELPAADGNANQVIKTDGSGNLDFVDMSGGTSWQAIQTSGFTAAAGKGYPCNTTSAAFTVTLPASPSLGDEVTVVDYAGTADTNNITIGRNSKPIQGVAEDLTVATERAAFTLVFVDNTHGWLLKDK
tara:strand:+ start:12628 stop:14706 length:2079 start_codon:yes stop_codon:yes gene_type:complete